MRSHGRPGGLAALAAAAVAFASCGSAAAAAPTLGCKLAVALERLPAPPVWFPSPQPAPSTLTVDVAAGPGLVHGLRWSIEDRSFWLGRRPHAGTTRDPEAKLVFDARFDNLGRTVAVVRRRDGRLYTELSTTGRGADRTVVVAKNMTATEFGEFLASLRKARYPTGC
jgi:hypothetical protein